ncbi:patatin [Citricoccus sp. SGAir0253]|uniref:patatin-like phospholipase family protein n=1 Tax=Citricoccus sp. SGAir0253 TaxID=2567881 RepID=UPI0010CCF225|nr:patatin-like phospholipase family protein [Citricoccus sp. SGAir0253]QCU79194.1 patatin [Citricoccus sp. SGAir0253]
MTSEPRRIAIACQGGGSHTAFTAGALSRFLREDVLDGHRVVGLSGTSGGAICAALAWSALLRRRPTEAEELLGRFWSANSATGWAEQALNAMVLWGHRMSETVAVPAVNPYLNAGAAWSAQQLRAAIDRVVDLDAAQEYATASVADPMLLIGAVDVLEGAFRTFDSRRGEISTDALLASAAIPSIFRAVRLGGGVYWDGLFSQNPPVHRLLDSRPDEVWVIQVNPSRVAAEPVTVGDIATRRNELSGNLSLYQELGFIEQVDRWLAHGIIRSDRVRHITVRILEMTRPPGAARWGSASKLNRDPAFIAELMEQGRRQAQEQVDAMALERDWGAADGDLAPVLDRFAEGAVVASTHPLAPLEPTSDRERIRRFLDEFGLRVETSRARVCAGGARWTVHSTADRRITAQVRAHFEDGRVTRLTVSEG